MKDELLYRGRLILSQREEVFPLSMDTMALADFASPSAHSNVWDLGCGSGALGLLLFGKRPEIYYIGVDSELSAIELAKQNLLQNHLTGKIFNFDIRNRNSFPAGIADYVISNPPYYSDGQGTIAHAGCTLEEIIAVASRILKNGGKFSIIFPASKMVAVLAEMQNVNLEPKRMKLVAHSPSKTPRLALIECVKNGKPGLIIEPCLYWYTDFGEKTGEYLRIYHEERRQ